MSNSRNMVKSTSNRTDMPEARERMPYSAVFFAASVGAILYATLRPELHGAAYGDPLCIFCGARGGADFVSNVLLFGPLGAALAMRGHGWARSVATGLALSLGIELAQVSVIAGRDATLGDLLANTVGAAVGWALVAWLWLAPPAHRAAERLRAVAATALAVGIAVLSLYLFRPAATERPLYLQWTARFGNLEHYQGRVLITQLGSVELREEGRITASSRFAAAFEARAPLRSTVVAGPRTRRLAPLVSVFDDRQEEIFLLGAERDHLVFRYRTLGAAARLDRTVIRFRYLLEGVSPGDTLGLSISGDHDQVCASLGLRHQCVARRGAAHAWLLLRGAGWYTEDEVDRYSALWFALLLLPAGVLAPRWRDRGLIGAAWGAVMLAAPAALGFPLPAAPHLLAGLVGLAAGGGLRRLRPAARRSYGTEISSVQAPCG